MRYIRTKTFITDLASWMKIDGKTLIIGGAKHEIVKQADTIEELCDEFVIKPSFSKAFLHDEDKQSLKSVKKKAIEIGCFEIYGAIWTDKGLIYVAKMNDKGELELL